jgi:hypothetical protein
LTDAFRATVRQQHAEALSIHRDVAIGVEEALLRERAHKDELGLALDMLLGQAYKAHLSVWLLSEHGHVEDAATIARRVMELVAQGVYIGMDDAQSTRTSRAGRFCAHLWVSLSEARMQLVGAWRNPGPARWCPLMADSGRCLGSAPRRPPAQPRE